MLHQQRYSMAALKGILVIIY